MLVKEHVTVFSALCYYLLSSSSGNLLSGRSKRTLCSRWNLVLQCKRQVQDYITLVMQTLHQGQCCQTHHSDAWSTLKLDMGKGT